MGWHYILDLECTLLQEFIGFVEKEYLRDFGGDYKPCEYGVMHQEEKNASLSSVQVALLEKWCALDINYFYEYTINKEGVFKCRIEKKVTRHVGDLWEDYLRFLRTIVVPISSKITSCRISSDDYGDVSREYSDADLRGSSPSIGKQYLQSLCEKPAARADILAKTITYIRNCVIDAAKHGSSKLVIDNFNYAPFGSNTLRGGMVLTSNTDGVGHYDGTMYYYEIVCGAVTELRAIFLDSVVEISHGKLVIDWS